MSDNRVRQNYHEECESEINKQINRELYASYVYLSMVRDMRECVRSKSWDAQLAFPNDTRYARLETNLGIGQAKEG
ncbi:hypothetical protein TNCV_3908931 [Trichonephila clavipes]|nr:hypothetical protein TNCV_3908931 [Trichonephila clavipes]